MTIEIFMIVGFCLAAYSIVGNDVPQTLGTFISSNAHRPRWVLWLYTSSILAVVLMYGWWTSGIGDASYGRLETIPFPEEGITVIYSSSHITDSAYALRYSGQYYFSGSYYFLTKQSGFNADQINDGLCSGFYCGNFGLSFCY